MKVACLLLAHSDLSLLSLYAEPFAAFDFFVHVDRKPEAVIVPPSLFKHSNVFRADQQRDVYWGGASIHETIFALLQQAHAQDDYDYFLILSEACFPIQPADTILAELSTAPSDRLAITEYCEADEPLSELLQQRFYLHLNDSSWFNARIPPQGLLQDAVRRCWNRCMRIRQDHFPPPSRPFPIIAKGSTWSGLSADSVAYILRYIEANPKTVRRVRYCGHGDEFVLQSILANRPGYDFPERFFVQCDNEMNTHYIRWPDHLSQSPHWLGADDWAALEASSTWFARKLSLEHSRILIERLLPKIGRATPALDPASG